MSTSQPRRGFAAAAERALQERLTDPLLTGVHEYRALRYVWLLNGHGYVPTVHEVAAYFERPDRRQPSSQWASPAAVQRLATMLLGNMEPVEGESVLEYLMRLHWIEKTEATPPRVRITALGSTLCRAVEAQRAAEAEDQALVLDPQDPFAYARFSERLGQLTNVLVVDPYMRLQQLIDLHPIGSIRRILVGDRLPEADKQTLVLALPSTPQVKEIRVSVEAHDRFLIPEGGDVWAIGASVNGIGVKISVMNRITGHPAEQIRKAHEEMWAEAEVLASANDDAQPGPEPPATELDQLLGE